MSESQRQNRLSESGEKITKLISLETDVSFIKGNKVNESKLDDVAGNYEEMKEEFNFENFCIYFEEVDGDLVSIETEEGDTYYGIGNQDATINDVECGQLVS